MPAFAWCPMTQPALLSPVARGTASVRSGRSGLAVARWSRWSWAGESSCLSRWNALIRRPQSRSSPALILQVVATTMQCVRKTVVRSICAALCKHSSYHNYLLLDTRFGNICVWITDVNAMTSFLLFVLYLIHKPQQCVKRLLFRESVFLPVSGKPGAWTALM